MVQTLWPSMLRALLLADAAFRLRIFHLSLRMSQSQAQLRGMIGDFKGGDEVLLSQALEAFDTLTNTTTEYRAALEGKSTGAPAKATSVAGGAPKLQPPSSNPFQVTASRSPPWIFLFLQCLAPSASTVYKTAHPACFIRADCSLAHASMAEIILNTFQDYQ